MMIIHRNNALIAVVAGVAGFSLKSIFIKLAWLEGIDPVSLMGCRMLLSMPFFLLAWICKRREQQQRSGTGVRGIIYCSVLYYISSLSDMAGLTMISVNIERLILFTIPIFVLLISILFMRKRYPVTAYIAALLSWVGVAIAYYGESHQSEAMHSLYGVGLIFISAATYAGYFIISGEELKNRGFIVFNSQVMLLSCLYSLIPFLFHTQSIHIIFKDFHFIKYPLLLALFSTVAPSFLMMYGVKKCGPVTVAIINNIGPFFTMVCGCWLLDQPVSFQDLIGMSIVII